jgi:hypothetical protein
MKRLGGPELKAPDIKVPPFVQDVYYDLRERRLLPLLALVVVATIAVPFLLANSEEAELPPAVSSASGAEGQTIDTASLKVVQAKPGLREYKKRLAHRTPHNPFMQKFTGPVTTNAQLNEPTSSTSSSTVTTTTSTGGESSGGGGSSLPVSTPPTNGGPPASSGPPTSSPSGKKHGELTLFSYAINVKITKNEKGKSRKKPQPMLKKGVLPQTPLPGEKAPVVTFMGPGRTKDNKLTGKALLLVSDQVKSVFGEAHCISGDGVCQLLEAEPGFPITFVYGENEVRYTVNVLKLSLIVTGRKKYSREARMFVP